LWKSDEISLIHPKNADKGVAPMGQKSSLPFDYKAVDSTGHKNIPNEEMWAHGRSGRGAAGLRGGREGFVGLAVNLNG
jgi:hypothetical protein